MSHSAIDTVAAMRALEAHDAGLWSGSGVSKPELIDLIVRTALAHTKPHCDAPVESLATVNTPQPAGALQGLSGAQAAIVSECEAVRDLLRIAKRTTGDPR